MCREKHLARGIAAGMAAGFAASWMMNAFMSNPGQKLQQAVQTPEENEREAIESEAPKEDATMKTADAVVSTITGGKHLAWNERQQAGSVVHYAFGSLMGALYGGSAEYWPIVRSGFGAIFGAVLFVGADLIAVPVLKFGPSPAELPAKAEVSPLAAHLVYGITTELFRCAIRIML